MKRWRVVATGLVLTAVILFSALVPLPISRVRGTGLVEAHAGRLGQGVRPATPACWRS